MHAITMMNTRIKKAVTTAIISGAICLAGGTGPVRADPFGGLFGNNQPNYETVEILHQDPFPNDAWSALANTCTPDDETREDGDYITSNGLIQHGAYAIGQLGFSCGIDTRIYPTGLAANSDIAYRLRLKYVDAPGNAENIDIPGQLLADAKVTATVKAVDKATGTVSEITTLSSYEQDSDVGDGLQTAEAVIEELDFSANFYFVDLGIERSSLGVTPQVIGVEIIPEHVYITYTHVLVPDEPAADDIPAEEEPVTEEQTSEEEVPPTTMDDLGSAFNDWYKSSMPSFSFP